MTQFGSFHNQLFGNGNPAKPEVGMGVTEIMWSDRLPYTVVEIVNFRKVVIQADKATRLDNLGMTDAQNWECIPNPDGRKIIISLRKDGKWYRVGDHTTPFAIGMRSMYYDYSF